MAWPVRPEFLSLHQWKDLVYVSQISSENGPHSNFIWSFRSDRSKAQTFCVPWPFNNLTVLTVLRESALGPGLLPYSLGFTTALCSEMHWWNATSNALMLMLYTAKNAQVVPSWYRQAWTMLCGQLWTNCQPCCSKLFQLNNAVTTCWQYSS
jgi:hypothetical protein